MHRSVKGTEKCGWGLLLFSISLLGGCDFIQKAMQEALVKKRGGSAHMREITAHESQLCLFFFHSSRYIILQFLRQDLCDPKLELF